ncbi:MAG TPA: hypothetical protein DEO85_07430 [Maritimibacter sp.]|nr:hypothetical protein [Maritimibacter sp.]
MSGSIVIADDLVTERIALKARLTGTHHRLAQASGRADLMREFSAGPPDAVVMDIEFDQGRAIEICRDLKSTPRFRDVPILLYGAKSDRDARIAAFEAGADECLADLPGERLLLALLRNLIRKRATLAELERRHALVRSGEMSESPGQFQTRMNVAVVTRDPKRGIALRRDIEPACPGAIALHSFLNVLEITDDAATVPDSFLIEEIPGDPGHALRLISELRARRASKDAVILLLAQGDFGEAADMALDLGADAVAPGSATASELALRLTALVSRKRDIDRLRQQVDTQLDAALRDPLTGLFNRRYADSYLCNLGMDAKRTQTPYSVMILDLDHFKSINDRHGHFVGDAVLRTIADRLKANIRDVDLAARIGGEEFLVVWHDAGADRAERVAERLRQVIGGRPVSVPKPPLVVPVTASIGVATAEAGDADLAALLEAADQALYLSKAAGRDQVTFAPSQDAA